MSKDERYDKAIGQFRLTIHGVLNPLRMYGQGHYVETATEEIVSLAIQLHQRLSGIDMPYHINHHKLRY